MFSISIVLCLYSKGFKNRDAVFLRSERETFPAKSGIQKGKALDLGGGSIPKTKLCNWGVPRYFSKIPIKLSISPLCRLEKCRL